MTKQYIFEGHSDDIFGEYGTTKIDYDDGASCSVIDYIVTRPGGEGVRIRGQYTEDGTWSIGMALTFESKPLNKEDWQIYFEPNKAAPYCNRLVVNAPDDAKLKCLRSGEEE